MCILIWDGDKEISTSAELAARIGADNIVFEPYAVPEIGDTCLCPIDIEASVKKAGLSARRDWEWAGDYILEASL